MSGAFRSRKRTGLSDAQVKQSFEPLTILNEAGAPSQAVNFNQQKLDEYQSFVKGRIGKSRGATVNTNTILKPFFG